MFEFDSNWLHSALQSRASARPLKAAERTSMGRHRWAGRDPIRTSRQGWPKAFLGMLWGCRVCDGYVCPQEALFWLMHGAQRMRSFRQSEQWDMAEVQDKLRSAILRGEPLTW
jgi:hypothetical protein